MGTDAVWKCVTGTSRDTSLKLNWQLQRNEQKNASLGNFLVQGITVIQCAYREDASIVLIFLEITHSNVCVCVCVYIALRFFCMYIYIVLCFLYVCIGIFLHILI